MSQISIKTLENNNRVVDKTPRIQWSFIDTYSSHKQSAYRISLKKVGEVNYTIPAAGDIKNNYSGIDYAEYALSNKDGYYYYHDVKTPLSAGTYDVYVRSKDSNGDPANPWTEPTNLQFTVINSQENIIRFSVNTDAETPNFGNYWSTSNVDITTNPERVKLSEVNHTIYKDGYLVLEADSGYNDTVWDTITYSISLPSSSSIKLYARASNDSATINNGTWSGDLASGGDLVYPNQVHITGRYIQIMVELIASSTKLSTPSLEYLVVSYTTPDISGETQVLSLSSFYKPSTNKNVTYVYSATEPNSDNKVVLSADPAKTINIYKESGYDIIKIELDYAVNMQYLLLDFLEPGNSSVKCQFKTFNDILDEPQTSWSDEIDPIGNIVSIQEDEVRFIYIKLLLNAQTDTYDTPKIKSMTLFFENFINPGISYFYSFNYLLNSNLRKILLTANDNLRDTRNCNIQYGICCTNSTDFNDYQVIDKNRLVKFIVNPGSSIRVGAKMISGSTTYKPEIHELGFVIEDVDASHIYLNE